MLGRLGSKREDNMGLPARLFRYIRDQIAQPNEDAIWVFGMQKSGTSAIAGLLAERTRSSVTIDTPYLWFPFRQKLRSGELSVPEIVNTYSYDFSKDIIKEPGATFILAEIDRYFLLKKYVFIVRHPLQTIRSILNRLSLPGDQPAISLEEVDPKWRYFFENGGGKGYVADLAHRWCQANAQYKWIFSPQCKLIKYEDFQKDKVAVIDELALSLGLQPQKDISARLDHSYQPRGNAQVNLKSFFGPENYAAILEICESPMKRLGYPAS